MSFMKIFSELEFNRRCRRLTAVIGAFAVMLTVTSVICRAVEPPIALRQFFALIGSLCACGMLNVYAAMAAGEIAKLISDKAGIVFCAADSASLALKLFFLLSTCGGGLPIACAALIMDAVFSRVYLLYLKKQTVQFS